MASIKRWAAAPTRISTVCSRRADCGSILPIIATAGAVTVSKMRRQSLGSGLRQTSPARVSRSTIAEVAGGRGERPAEPLGSARGVEAACPESANLTLPSPGACERGGRDPAQSQGHLNHAQRRGRGVGTGVGAETGVGERKPVSWRTVPLPHRQNTDFGAVPPVDTPSHPAGARRLYPGVRSQFNSVPAGAPGIVEHFEADTWSDCPTWVCGVR